VVIGLFLTWIALLATVGILFAPRFWVADLGVHFRLQFAALAIAGVVILAATAEPAWAAVAFLVAAVNLVIAAPHVLPRGAPAVAAAGDAGPVIRLATINVYYRNRQFQRVVDFIRHERPDAVVLVEVTAEWDQALTALDDEYAQRYVTRGTKGAGVLLLSRWPMQAAILPDYADAEPAVTATLQLHGRSLQLLGVHTSWPLGPRCSALRDQQLERLGEFARLQSGPLVILGDLNVSPFSRHLQALVAGGQLKSAAQGRGWQPTWPTFLPPAGIHIDHALISGGVLVRGFRRGTRVGSDHLPVIVDIALESSAAQD
jgi:endonuclease/exonuclease/phosphatase (EEP) superfamily protein YafD